jgi:hypothetical protein
MLLRKNIYLLTYLLLFLNKTMKGNTQKNQYLYGECRIRRTVFFLLAALRAGAPTKPG